jgi:hypothetical protein
MEFNQIIEELKKPFKPHQHEERKIPGGGRWLYVPWQHIRERLDEVYPQWSCTWGNPYYLDDYCFVKCEITIAGISREAIGNAPIQLISNEGKNMARGTPIERAIADAFKNAAENFGVARYLDDQKLTAALLQKQGDLRAYKYAKENEEIEVGARGIAVNQQIKTITEPQVKRFWAIARSQYKLSDDDVKQVLHKFKLESTRDIPATLYDAVVAELGNFSTVNF